MTVLLASLPLLALLLTMLVLGWAAKLALALSALLALVISVTEWGLGASVVLASAASAFLSSIDIFLIIFGALFLFEVLKNQGRVEGIVRSLRTLSEDRQVLVLLLGWLLVSFFEGVAGFGTPAAIVAPIMVALGVSPIQAVILCLLGDSASVVFGAVGTPIVGGLSALLAQSGESIEFLQSVGARAALWNVFVLSFVPLLMLRRLQRGTEGRASMLFVQASVLGLAFTIGQWIFARYLGPELASCLPAVLCLAGYAFWLRQGAEKKLEEATGTYSALASWIPYLWVLALLLVTRLPDLPVKSWLLSAEIDFGAHVAGGGNLRWRPLYNPGLFPFLLVAFFLRKNAQHKKAWRVCVTRLLPALPVLFLGIFMVYLMNAGTERASMMMTLASAAGGLGGVLLTVLSPFIGTLGSFASGSATVSNIMFGSFQMNAAQTLGLDPVNLLSLQAYGAAVGNMICLHNIVAVLAIVGMSGKEAQVLRANLLPALLFCLVAGVLSLLFI